MTNLTILDGGMGQELVALSKNQVTPLWATEILLKEPDLVERVHNSYFDAGADVATTNSYATHRDRLQQFDLEEHFEDLLISACEIACRARDKHGKGLIAGGMGPNAKSYRPDLVLDLEEGAEIYSEIAGIQAPFVDLYLLETMVSLKQASGALMGATAHNKPVWMGVTVNDDDGALLRSGEPVADMLGVAEQYGAAAVLVNCSTPEAVSKAVGELKQRKAELDSKIELGAYANGFARITQDFTDINATVDQLETRRDLGPEQYLDFAKQWRTDGATIIGGCCEVGPKHIEMLAAQLA